MMNRETYYKNRPEKDFEDRSIRVWNLYKTGVKQKDIALIFKISAVRVSQILKERHKNGKSSDKWKDVC